MVRPQRRAGLLFFFGLILLSGVLVRAFWLQGVQGSTLASQAQYQQEDTVTVPGLRGPILDRNGQELAGSEEGADIYATPYQIKDPTKDSEDIAKALGADPNDVLKAITAPGGFSYVAKKVNLGHAAKVEKLGLEGVGEHPDSIRTRPQGQLASQVVGAVSDDGKGLTGLELGENSTLHGVDGERQIVNDALGDPISLKTLTDSSDGKAVQLTIDANIQAETEKVLAEVGAAHNPVNASAIVMDTKNSQILSMASWPPVNLDDLGNATSDQLLNQGTGYTYEPGSTFKAFTVASALESGTVTPESSFTLAPSIQVADRTIEDAEDRPTETLSVGQILAQSSNVGAITIGLQEGGRKFSNWINKFGFGKPTGIKFPGEEQGLVLPYKDYSGSTMGNLPIGQGLSVTPIQMIQGYGALANGGILRTPQLIKKIGDRVIPSDPGKRVISPQTATDVRTMLEGVLAPGGTASEVSVPGYTLAGKTGTAQIATDGGYSDTKYVASFMGIAPAQNPSIAVAVIVNQPEDGHLGGTVAAPAFGEIASYVLPYLGVPTE